MKILLRISTHQSCIKSARGKLLDYLDQQSAYEKLCETIITLSLTIADLFLLLGLINWNTYFTNAALTHWPRYRFYLKLLPCQSLIFWDCRFWKAWKNIHESRYRYRALISTLDSYSDTSKDTYRTSMSPYRQKIIAGSPSDLNDFLHVSFSAIEQPKTASVP